MQRLTMKLLSNFMEFDRRHEMGDSSRRCVDPRRKKPGMVLVLCTLNFTLCTYVHKYHYHLFARLLDRVYFEERTNYAPTCEDTVPQVQTHGR